MFMQDNVTYAKSVVEVLFVNMIEYVVNVNHVSAIYFIKNVSYVRAIGVILERIPNIKDIVDYASCTPFQTNQCPETIK